MKDKIVHSFHYNHPPEVVWNYLTDSELLSQWLMKNNMKPIVGHEFQFNTRPMPNFGFDGTIYCKVLEVEPLKKLSYSWKGGPTKGQISLDTIVVWTLQEKDNGTSLLLEHTGFGESDNLDMYAMMDNGWLKNIKEIDQLINKATHDTANA